MGGCFLLVTDLPAELHPDGHREMELRLTSAGAAAVLGASVFCLSSMNVGRGARLVQPAGCRESLPGQSHARSGSPGTDVLEQHLAPAL